MAASKKDLVSILENLRDSHGVVAVKAELETEGSRLPELMRLRAMASECGLGVVLKIGGPEAVSNIFDATNLCVSGIVAPMVESAYALKKYLEAIAKHIPEGERDDFEIAINIETKQACQNFDAMLALSNIGLLGRITIGRGDLVGSLGLARDEINSPQVFGLTKEVCLKAVAANLKTTVGGGITVEAIPFLTRLVEEGLLEGIETRKVVFSAIEGVRDPSEALVRANEFELQWLRYKRDHYLAIAAEDEARIEAFENRYPRTASVA